MITMFCEDLLNQFSCLLILTQSQFQVCKSHIIVGFVVRYVWQFSFAKIVRIGQRSFQKFQILLWLFFVQFRHCQMGQRVFVLAAYFSFAAFPRMELAQSCNSLIPSALCLFLLCIILHLSDHIQNRMGHQKPVKFQCFVCAHMYFPAGQPVF